jgi:hypothetical protein
MTPAKFPEPNSVFGAPADMHESQVGKIDAFRGQIVGGNIDGSEIVVVAWQPSPEEIEEIKNGALVYLKVIGGLPPHYIATSFKKVVGTE